MLYEDLVIDEAYWAEFPDVLSMADLARITRKKHPTIWRWLAEGQIPAHSVAGSWIVYREVLQHKLESPDVPYVLPVEFFKRFPEELSVADLATMLGKTQQTAWRWLADSKVPGRKVANTWLVYKHEVTQFLIDASNQKSKSTE